MSWLADHLLLVALLGAAVVQASGVVAAFHVLARGRTSQGILAWFLALVLMPALSLPLYLVFGPHRFWGYVRARRAGNQLLQDLVHQVTDHAPLSREEDDGFDAVAEQLAQMPFTPGNRVRLLVDGEATFDAIFAAIEGASEYLLLQFYIIRDDRLGRRLQRLLMEKARGGVRVRLLYDAIGSFALPGGYVEALRMEGVEVHPFGSATSSRSRLRLNFRNHRKIVVVDGRLAFLGGHNVGDEYLGRDPRFGRWRDTHLELSGPAVHGVQLAFLEDWHWVTGARLELNLAAECAVTDGARTLILPSGPADERESCTLFFVGAIERARRRVWIVSPYFVPDEVVMTALALAVLRGVDVRVMLPEKADHLLVYLSSYTYLAEAEETGVRFFRYSDGFLHQKVMLVDDDLATVGTVNFDNRSFHINFEITAVVRDRAFAAEVERMLEIDFARCREVSRGEYLRRPLPYRAAARLARLLSPIQ